MLSCCFLQSEGCRGQHLAASNASDSKCCCCRPAVPCPAASRIDLSTMQCATTSGSRPCGSSRACQRAVVNSVTLWLLTVANTGPVNLPGLWSEMQYVASKRHLPIASCLFIADHFIFHSPGRRLLPPFAPGPPCRARSGPPAPRCRRRARRRCRRPLPLLPAAVSAQLRRRQ